MFSAPQRRQTAARAVAGSCSRPNRLRLLLTLAVALATFQLAATSASGEGTSQPNLVTAVPGTNTPDVLDGSVFAFAEIESHIIAGGTFTKVANHGDAASTNHPYIVAFDQSTGAVDQTFDPQLDGEVDALASDSSAHAVYAGGRFQHANGAPTRLVKLDADTGATMPGWSAPALNGSIKSIVVAADKVFVAGTFTKAGATSNTMSSHAGLIAVDPDSGQLLPYVDIQVSGHHSWTPTNGYANGATGISQIDANPDGSQLVAIGNFTSVDGYDRDQIVRLNLGLGSLSVDTTWRTRNFTALCSKKYDSTIRDVRFSPDGTYFAVVSSGAGGLHAMNSDGTASSCDTIQRFDSGATGGNVRPTWTDHTGNDSLWSVETTGTAIYAGGHFRWFNNSFGQDSSAAGAVPRPGIVAVDPANGLPLPWNPGRNPRGVGTFALMATVDGLYVGSDTDFFGNRTYRRDKIGFFPLAGGVERPANQPSTLPGRVYEAGGFATGAPPLVARHFDGTTVGPTSSQTGGVGWRQLRGAFVADHTLYYGKANGYLYSRTVSGASFGAPRKIDPYNDPAWNNVLTGSKPGQTYRGALPTFYTEDLAHVSSMFYAGGKVYYTLSGDSAMYWRYFSPESGVVGADRFALASGPDWSDTAGAFLSGDKLYFATKSDGNLHATTWASSGASGPGTVVDSSADWSARALFLVSDQTTYEPIAFDGANVVSRPATTSPSVTVPGSVSAGDTLVLFATVSTTTPSVTRPNGWTEVDTQANGAGLRTTLFTRTATGGDASRQVTVTLGKAVRSSLAVGAYSGAGSPSTSAFVGDSGTTTHASPPVSVAAEGSWVVNYWADKSNSPTTGWTPPAEVVRRGESFGYSSPDVSSLLTDSGQPVPAGTYTAGDATANASSIKANAWAIVLAPVG